jgi:hypothetical protein
MGTADRLTSKSAIPISLSQISLSGPIQLSFQPIQRFSSTPSPRIPKRTVHTELTLHKPHLSQPPVPTARSNPAEKNNKTRTLGLQPGPSLCSPRAEAGGGASNLSHERYTSPIPTDPPTQPRKKAQKTNNPEMSGSNREHPFLPAGRGGLSVRLGSFRFGDLRRSCA